MIFTHHIGTLTRIQKCGFEIKQGTLRTESLCMLVSDIDGVSTAIQLIEKGSKFEMFIKFRDRLNNNHKLVEEYNRLMLKA